MACQAFCPKHPDPIQDGLCGVGHVPNVPMVMLGGFVGEPRLLGHRTSHVLVPPSPRCHHSRQKRPTEEHSISRRDGWRPSPYSGKDPSCPRDPMRCQPMRRFTPVEATSANAPQPILGSCQLHPAAQTHPTGPGQEVAGDSLPWSGERRSKRKTFILGSSLLWLGLQEPGRMQKKGPREYLRYHRHLGVRGAKAARVGQRLASPPTPWCLCHQEEPRALGILPGRGLRGGGPTAPAQAPTTNDSAQEGSPPASHLGSGLGFLSRVIGTEGNSSFLIHQP